MKMELELRASLARGGSRQSVSNDNLPSLPGSHKRSKADIGKALGGRALVGEVFGIAGPDSVELAERARQLLAQMLLRGLGVTGLDGAR